MDPNMKPGRILFIEPFYGGSHKQLMDYLVQLSKSMFLLYDLYTMPSKKWHWRARTSALYMSKQVPKSVDYSTLICSSVLNLAEFIALREDLRHLRKVVYFHENQFIYPLQETKDRDFQYGYNTILTALVADTIIFNSHYNKDTFLNNIYRHLKKQPDFPVTGLSEELRDKCLVIYFPVEIPTVVHERTNEILHIVWPHRWEHDKNPQMFFESLFKLKEDGCQFQLSVLGESFKDSPAIFAEARTRLRDNIINFGMLKNKNDYFLCLSSCHIVISTSNHEFFGVAMLEAVLCGCYPIAPSNLVYPELYPKECLYKTQKQFIKMLRTFCLKPYLVEHSLKNLSLKLDRFSPSQLKEEYKTLLRA